MILSALAPLVSITGEIPKRKQRTARKGTTGSLATHEAATETFSQSGLPDDSHVLLLERILEKRQLTLEKWAQEKKFGRTTVFDWKSRRHARKPLKGKVSVEKCKAIAAAIEKEAKELGLPTRIGSD